MSTTPPKPRRGRPPRLNRARIVDAALDLVDRDGMPGLTMRALARDLGVDPMAVYRHLRDKDDLLGAMCDRLLAELDPIDAAAPWEPQVRRLADQMRERLVARPALVPVLTQAPVTPESIVIAGQAIDLLVRAGLTPREAGSAFGALFSYVLGFAAVEAALPPPADHAELRRAALEHAGGTGAAGQGPAHLDAAIELMNDAGDFGFGVDLVLDGLRRRITSVR